MAGVLRRDAGGIQGLRRLAAEHPEALQYELLKLGLRLELLGSRRLTWFDLKAIVISLPPGNAIHRARDPEDARWDLAAHLAASAVDAIALGNWQRAGDQHARRPDPIRRPGVGPAAVHVPTAEERTALNQRLGGAFLQQGE